MGADVARVAHADERVGTLALGTLAAVHAALGEGHELAQVLALERVEAASWQQEELGWKVRLADEEAVLASYRELFGREQDRLSAKVLPLENDLESWVAFLRIYQSHGEPFALLREIGLELAQVARLSRRWRTLCELPEVARAAERAAARIDKIARRGRLELPPIRIVRTALGASSFVRARGETAAAAAAGETGSLDLERFGIDVYASLEAELAAWPELAERVLGRHGLDGASLGRLRATYRRTLDTDPQMGADYRALYSHYVARARLRQAELREQAAPRPWAFVAAGDAPGAIAPGAAVPERSIDETALLGGDEVFEDPLPFVLPLPGLTRPPPRFESPPEPDLSGMTSDAIPAFRDEDVLPFKRPASIDGTSELDVASLQLGPALPFRAPGPGAGPDGNPTMELALCDLDFGTADAADGTSLPRAPSAPARLRARPPAPPPRRPAAAPQDELGRTTFVEAFSFGDDALTEEPAPRPPAPRLTLEQYASLEAELAVHPAHRPAVLGRYGLHDERAYAELQYNWQIYFAAAPHEQRSFEAAFTTYADWLQRQR